MPMANSTGTSLRYGLYASRLGGLTVALGACLALSCPTTAFADSADSAASSPSVGHSKRAAGTTTTARGRTSGKSAAAARVPVIRIPRTDQSRPVRIRIDTADDAPAVVATASSPRAPQPASTVQFAPVQAAATVAAAARTMNPIESVISGVLGVFGFNPNTDPDLSFGMAVLAWVRREVEHALFNQAPTIAYNQTTNSLTVGGAITGNVGASDPEGDPLVYSITQQPASGTVTIGDDGTFVYSPTTPMQAGDTAQFVVAVTDTGLHLHGLASLLSPQTAGTTTATITVAAIVAGQTPALSISDATATEPGSGKVGDGFWHTSGNQILDAAGNPVEIAGVNWFGFESDNGTPHGLWTRNYKDMMDQMVTLGFNTIRLPYSQDVLHGQNPTSINYYANPDLEGLSSIQVMDKIIAYAGEVGLKVILDHHRNTAGVGTTDNGLWYNGTYSETDWVNDWVTLTRRYADNPTVIGVDLHNEPYNGTWGGGGTNDWARAAERAGNAVLAANPNLLIIVEGVGTYNNQNYWWGGNLMGVKDRPITLNVANRVVYSPHDYPNSVYAQTWFSGSDFGTKLPGVFDNAWGYIYENDIAPIYLGEFGTKLTDPKDVIWYEAITSYLSGDLDNNGTIDIPAGDEGISWTYWSWNPNSGDTGGILADDWRTVNQNKVTYLQPIMFDFGDGTGTSAAQFTVTLASPSTQTVTVHYATSGGTAIQGSDYVGASGTVTFLPGETSKTVTILVLGDSVAENSETFTVALSSPTNATLSDATGVGTIVNAV